MTVLRRLDGVLEPTRDMVVRKAKGLERHDAPEEERDTILKDVADRPFYNTSKRTFEKLKGADELNVNSQESVLNVWETPTPWAEQDEIARYIGEQNDQTTSVREGTERTIDLLEDRRTALITDAVTRQLQLAQDEIWMDVFDNYPEVKRCIVDAYPGTAESCYDDDMNTVSPRPITPDIQHLEGAGKV